MQLSKPVVVAIMLIVLAIGIMVLPIPAELDPRCPGPNCPNNPQPDVPKKPDKPRRPWDPRDASVEAQVVQDDAERRPWWPRPIPLPEPMRPTPPGPPPGGKISVGGPVSPDGREEIQVDLPVEQRMANIGSRVDGAGMCVSTAIEMAARWANLTQMQGFRDWCAKFPGGSYAQKTDKQIKQFCAEKGIRCPDYIQYEGNDPSVLEMVLATGRLPAATYGGQDGVRYRGRISHMICVPHFGKEWACVLDSNGSDRKLGCLDNEMLWMSPADYVARWKMGGGGWLFVWLGPPALPIPVN